MAYSPLTPSIYVGAAPSYFTDTRPDALTGRLQSVTFNEGLDANRPFQRFRNSRLDFEIIISAAEAGERPYQAGQLVWLEVAAGAGAAEVWFKGLLRDPDYDVRRSGRSSVRMTAIDVSDVFKETISIASQSNGTIAENFGLLLDGVGWPDDADWRDIDADLIEQLSTWEHDDRPAIRGLQELADTTGPPARMVIKRNGGLQVIKDVSDTVEYSFDDSDVRSRPVVRQHEDSVINTVTIEGTTLGSLSSTVRNRRPLEYDVLDGLAATERVNVIRRILAAYQNGLTSLTQEMPADDDRNQADVLALRPGTVIELDSETLGQTYQGSVSSLRWEWRRTRATVRVNVEIQPPVSEVVGVRLYMVAMEDFGTTGLYIIDVETGLGTRVDVGVSNVSQGLAYDPNNDVLYGTNSADLYRINPTTGAGTLIGSFGLVGGRIYGLAYDSERDILYGVGGAPNGTRMRIWTVDPATAVPTEIPTSIGTPTMRGAAFDPSTGRLFMGGFVDNVFYSVDPTDVSTLTSVQTTPTGIHRIFGLAYDPSNHYLYALAEQGPLGHGLVRLQLTGNWERVGTADNFGLSGGDLTGYGLAYMRLESPQLTRPTGLSITESGGDITADWNDVTDATGYVLEWREEGSGAAWQTVDVSAPPHTFTP